MIDHELMRFVAGEARGLVAVFDNTAERYDVDAIAIAAVLVGIDIALRAAVVDPIAGEQLRDRIADVIHHSPGADPRGADHATAAALRLIGIVR